MPWTLDDPPKVAENWTDEEKELCVNAANSVLLSGGDDQEAIFACIAAAGKSKLFTVTIKKDGKNRIDNFEAANFKQAEQICNEKYGKGNWFNLGIVHEYIESKAVSDLDLTPPKKAQENAKRGLELREKWGRGGTQVGVARARDISNGSRLSPETVKRMASFNRHRDNYRPDERESDGGQTAGTIAWLLWGGTEGIDWSLRMSERIDEESNKKQQMKTKTFDFEVTSTKEFERNGQRFGTIKGYASTFGNVDRGGDRVMRGAFKNSIEQLKQRDRPIRMLWHHNMDQLIGGFREFSEDEKGLYVEGDINLDVQKGKEAFSLAKQGVLTDMSIGYLIRESESVNNVLELKEVDLLEISLVSEPMNQQANITEVKNFNVVKNASAMGDISKYLKSLGLTDSQEKVLISKVKEFSRDVKEKETPRDVEQEASKKADEILASLGLSNLINDLKG